MRRALTIADLIASRAEGDRGAVAIRSSGRAPLTYAGLHAAVGEVAQTLQALGLEKDDRVALVLPNGPEMAVAFLTIASAMGCAPLNPSCREDDFAFFFADLGVRAVVVDGAGKATAAMAAARRLELPVIELDRLRDAPAGLFVLRGMGLRSRGAPPRSAATTAPDHTALVLHTSGTTARPKIVPLTHRNLCSSADNVRSTLALQPFDVCLNVMPLFHIHGLVGALLASIAGGAGIDCAAGFRSRDFPARLRESGATWYTAVPTIHHAILEAIGVGGSLIRDHHVRFVRSASAALPPRLMHELGERFGVPVIESYGMTEASHQIASNPLQRGSQKPGSVGLPAGPDIALLSESGRITRDGGTGEIVVRGETVTTGYEADPQANAAAFVDGWFRTGDQGYLDDDGYLVLTARLKELINRGGEKIAPREIEDALLRHAAVARAVAFAIPHERLGEEVGAAVVLKADAHATPGRLREVAAQALPYFKVPRVIEVVDEIPTGPTGKVQRSGLAQALGLVGRVTADGRPPQSPLEHALAREWRRLLRVDAITVEDDFFAVGGDSLAATELIVFASELLQTEIPVLDFLERPTIEGLVECGARAASMSAAERAAGTVAIQTGANGAPIFCPAPHDDSLWRVSRLIRHLGRERPVYGLRAPPIGARGPVPTIEELAERNVAAMLRIHPEGPRYLIGPCFGGVVAFEMARQLERLGRPVALLVMIDTFNHAWQRTHRGPSPAAIRARHFRHRVRFQLEHMRGLEPRERVGYLRERLRIFAARWSGEAGQWLFDAVTGAGLPRPPFLRVPGYANLRAERRYRPGPYSGRVLMARATIPVGGIYPLEHDGWGGLITGEVEMLEWPCEQRQLWWCDEFIEQIARAIRKRISEREAA